MSNSEICLKLYDDTFVWTKPTEFFKFWHISWIFQHFPLIKYLHPFPISQRSFLPYFNVFVFKFQPKFLSIFHSDKQPILFFLLFLLCHFHSIRWFFVQIVVEFLTRYFFIADEKCFLFFWKKIFGFWTLRFLKITLTCHRRFWISVNLFLLTFPNFRFFLQAWTLRRHSSKQHITQQWN